MYNTKYICSYTAPVNKNIDADKDNSVYRKDILNIFSIDTFNETIITNEIDNILHKVKLHPEFKICLEKMSQIYKVNDLGVGLLLLYSFDYLYLTHPCICEFLETGTIQSDKTEMLLQVLSLS